MSKARSDGRCYYGAPQCKQKWRAGDEIGFDNSHTPARPICSACAAARENPVQAPLVLHTGGSADETMQLLANVLAQQDRRIEEIEIDVRGIRRELFQLVDVLRGLATMLADVHDRDVDKFIEPVELYRKPKTKKVINLDDHRKDEQA